MRTDEGAGRSDGQHRAKQVSRPPTRAFIATRRLSVRFVSRSSPGSGSVIDGLGGEDGGGSTA